MNYKAGPLTERKKRWLAIILMVLSALMFSCMQLPIKLTGEEGDIPLMEQVFFRNLFSLVGSFIVLLRLKIPMFGSAKAQPFLFARSIAGFLAILTYFYASSHANIADAQILNRLSPFVVIILSLTFLKEKVTKIQVASLFITFAGAWIVSGPLLKSQPLAMLMALLSSVFSGVAFTLVSYLKDKANPMSVIMHFSALSVVLAFILMLPVFVLPTLTQLGLLLLIGLFGSAGQVTLTYSYKYAPASEVSIYSYAGIVWSVLLGWIFLQEKVTWSFAIGSLLIVGASLAVFLSNNKIKTVQEAEFGKEA